MLVTFYCLCKVPLFSADGSLPLRNPRVILQSRVWLLQLNQAPKQWHRMPPLPSTSRNLVVDLLFYFFQIHFFWFYLSPVRGDAHVFF